MISVIILVVIGILSEDYFYWQVWVHSRMTKMI